MSEFQIPDGIEPEEAWRYWNFDGHSLLSLNGYKWLPGEHLTAECLIQSVATPMFNGTHYFKLPQKRWTVVAGDPKEYVPGPAPLGAIFWVGGPHPSKPNTVLPDGLSYQLEEYTDPDHPSPDPECACGIYAASSLAKCPDANVFGRVKLWGKIIPGERGFRAEFAYPSELWAPPKIAEHPALLAYGVPVHTNVYAEAKPKELKVDKNVDTQLITYAKEKGKRRWRDKSR